jgi:hypothetical protein
MRYVTPPSASHWYWSVKDINGIWFSDDCYYDDQLEAFIALKDGVSNIFMPQAACLNHKYSNGMRLRIERFKVLNDNLVSLGEIEMVREDSWMNSAIVMMMLMLVGFGLVFWLLTHLFMLFGLKPGGR